MDRATVFVWHLQDVLSSRQHISLKISTKIIVDFSQRQQSHNVNCTTDKKAGFSSFISTTFQGNLPNEFASNWPRDISPVHSCTLKSRCQFVDEEKNQGQNYTCLFLKGRPGNYQVCKDCVLRFFLFVLGCTVYSLCHACFTSVSW